MRKFFIVSLILFLILFTAIIKNSTKKIEEEIFITTENLRVLNKELGNFKLEFEYLSSAEKLLEFQNLYFDDELNQIDINDIKIINKSSKKLLIKDLKIIMNDEK